MSKRIYCIISVLTALLALAACSSLTSAHVQKVTRGMTQDQVTTLLGQPEHVDHSEITGLTGDVYYYTSSHANAQVVFVNGQVFVAHYHPNPRGGIRFL